MVAVHVIFRDQVPLLFHFRGLFQHRDKHTFRIRMPGTISVEGPL